MKYNIVCSMPWGPMFGADELVHAANTIQEIFSHLESLSLSLCGMRRTKIICRTTPQTAEGTSAEPWMSEMLEFMDA